MRGTNVVLVVALVILTAGWALATGGRPAQAQPTEIIGLFTGCNNVSLTWPNGTPIATVAGAVSPADAVTAIWRFDNAARRFIGFAPAFPSASDLTAVNMLDPVFICVTRTANLTRPSLGGGPIVPTPGPAPTVAPPS